MEEGRGEMLRVVSASVGLAIALILLPACGGGKSQEQALTDRFLELMAYVPATHDYEQVCFSSPRRFLDSAGFEEVRTVDEAVALLEKQSLVEVRDTDLSIEAVSVPSLYTDYWKIWFVKLRDLLGVEFFAVEDLLSTGLDYLDVVRGPFDGEALAGALEVQNYAQEDHRGVPFYAIGGDFEPAFIMGEGGLETLTDLGSMVIDRMNRVWLRDGTLVAAPATQILTDAMDSASG